MRGRLGKQIKGRRGQYNGFRAGFRVQEIQKSVLHIHVLPFEGQDLAKTAAGEDQKAYCRGGVEADVGATIVFTLREVFGAGSIGPSVPWQPYGFANAEHGAQSFQFFRLEEPCALPIGILGDATRWIVRAQP